MKKKKKKNGNDLIKKVRNAQKKNDELSIELDEIEYRLVEEGLPINDPSRTRERPVLHAYKLDVSFVTEERASISINDMRPFNLSRVLGNLLQVLATDKGTMDGAGDLYVPYKSFDDITAAMSSRLEYTFTDRALKQAVYRLKNILSGKGFSDLIETSRLMRAYRLALPRKDKFVGAAAQTGMDTRRATCEDGSPDPSGLRP